MKIYIVMVYGRTDPDMQKSVSEVYLDKDRAIAAGKFIENGGLYYASVEEHMVN